MGWSGGSRLMSSIIEEFSKVGADNTKAEAFYSKLITLFEDDDCDTLEECLGEDGNFDIAFFKANPYQSGLYAGNRGEPLSANPWKKGSKQYKPWVDGWEDC
jgi:hypothetical protein